jgi:putative nucleotidyltransferase with HDIG domain
MLRRRGGGRRAPVLSHGLGVGLLVVGGCIAAAILVHWDRFGALSVILGLAALGAGLVYEGGEESAANVSASFIVIALAAALLGPVSAGVVAAISELTVVVRYRSPWTVVVSANLPACVLPAVGEGVLIHVLAWPPANGPVFYLVVAVAAVLGYLANFALVLWLGRVNSLSFQSDGLRDLLDSLPSTGLSLAFALAGIGIKLAIGNAGIAFALVAVLAFSYMIHLVRESRHRAEQYVSLSWGVLAGLMRSLDIRDERTARHSAAVARFARDIAAEVGMSEAECELAHTAGLLHDIGRFALSDRVFERGRTLTDEDWEAIQRHPELGADMLRDLGMYGPVSEIVVAHHERIDGRGYPHGLVAEEIPELAKIIAVAEVYDTLTASDTYRTRMSSFEALTELRRVAGSQLDARYIEVLAGLLTGEGVEYRHADAVDFDSELNMERRIRQAGTGR